VWSGHGITIGLLNLWYLQSTSAISMTKCVPIRTPVSPMRVRRRTLISKPSAWSPKPTELLDKRRSPEGLLVVPASANGYAPSNANIAWIQPHVCNVVHTATKEYHETAGACLSRRAARKICGVVRGPTCASYRPRLSTKVVCCFTLRANFSFPHSRPSSMRSTPIRQD